MKKTLITIALTLTAVLTASAQAIGTWRAYPAYSTVENIQQAGTTIFVQASGGLYSYNTTDHSITTYDKATQLSDCGISRTAWCQAAHRLVIVYENGNIDLLDQQGNVTNMSEYMDKSMPDNKTIFGLDISGTHAYLSTGFGIVNINVSDAIVTDTYNLGFRVDWCSLDNTRIYAHSAVYGTYSAPLSSNLLDPASWAWSSGYTEKQTIIDEELQALVKALKPGGPKHNEFGFIKFKNGKLYTASGVMEETAGVQIYNGEEWNIYDDSFKSELGHKYIGTYSADVDPRDTSHVFTASQTGVQEFLGGTFIKEYSIDNSPFQVAATVSKNNLNYVVVSDLCFDTSGNLWCLNSISPSTSLIELTNEGEWVSHHKQELFQASQDRSLDYMKGMMFDSRNLLWFVNDDYRLPSFYCYQPSTDAINSYIPTQNQDGTTIDITDIKCIAEDKDRNIWTGTNAGPLLLYASDITSGSPVYYQVKIPRNDGTNYADYLLNGVDVTAIAIDGGNRKWFGTSGNGIYQISADNLSQVQHFTASDSPLLSDNIMSLALDNSTGILYIGTDKGLCSYKTDATASSDKMTKDNVYAYPNPVRPDYTGMITVTGLTYNAEVKITTSNGVLVAEGRSTGGTFQWDGLDLNGKRVASGIYMVNTSTESGDGGTVCKIAVVN